MGLNMILLESRLYSGVCMTTDEFTLLCLLLFIIIIIIIIIIKHVLIKVTLSCQRHCRAPHNH